MLGAVGLFIYVVTDKALFLISLPTTVDVDVSYATDKMEFPSITICNENKYR